MEAAEEDKDPKKASEGKFSASAFGDYYFIANDHVESIEGRTGFRLRRVYLTYDRKISDIFSARVRLEMKQPDGFSNNADKAVPFLKDAYVAWRTGNQHLVLGIAPTPTWDVVEKVWGYRAVEKTPMDLYKLGSARDFGVGFKGKIDRKGKFRYHAMVGNGNGINSENDKGKKAMLSFGYYPVKELVFEVYADYFDRPGEADWSTFQAFAALKVEKIRIGLQYAYQERQASENQQMASLFGVFQFTPKSSTFFRIDWMFNPNPSGSSISYIPFSSNASSTYVLWGLDLRIHKMFSILPNLQVVYYGFPDVGDKPYTDLIMRMTFEFKL
ncbi:MAG: hypothetical protein GY940_03015 [bacterium]|nr:hypothetical protein [bacterium]